MAIPQVEPAPVTPIPTGTALDVKDETTDNVPTLFHPITIRGLHLQNRFVVSPMGTWSARDGHLTDFHLAHLGAFAIRGAALTIVESTSVTANGRTSPQDSGLWKDSQTAPLKRIVDYIHAHGQKAGIQLNHAGSRAGMLAPRLAKTDVPVIATEAEGGWADDVWAPTTTPFDKPFCTPKAFTKEGIDTIIKSFGDATRRAVQAGIDFVEIHGAHGYLIHQFLSPLTNQRTDEYGGSFENRVRFALGVIKAIRDELPNTVPLSFRISATEWMEWSGRPSWDVEESIKFARLLPEAGVDILDVSSGGHAEQRIVVHPRYQIDLAGKMRQALEQDGVKLLVATVGLINTPEVARAVVEARIRNGGSGCAQNSDHPMDEIQASLAFVGKQFLREPGFVLRSAAELGVEVQWPFQYDKAKQ